MVGFTKYERYLNKKRKKEAYLDLVDSSNSKLDVLPCEKNIESTSIGDNSSKEVSNSFKNEYSEVKKKYKDALKKKMETPKLFLQSSGERSLLLSSQSNVNPLPFICIQNLLFSCVSKQKEYADQMKWCTLLRVNRLSRVVVVIIDGLGLSELASVHDWLVSTKSTTLETLSESSTREEADHSLCNKRKRRKIDSSKFVEVTQTSEKGANEKLEEGSTVLYHEMFRDLLPLSGSLFPLCLEVESPSQYSLNPTQELISYAVSKRQFQGPEYDAHSEDPAIAADCHLTRTNTSSTIDVTPISNVDHEDEEAISPTQENKSNQISVQMSPRKDKFDRTDLLLSAQELLTHLYPVPLESGIQSSTFSDSYSEVLQSNYSPLHQTSATVNSSSPMFAIDCEMCLTREGSELTRISVVDEELNVIYSSFVKPRLPIVNYLTQYSGVTEKHLSNVETRLEDVQETLRSILPKDAILVGHSLNSDLNALKISYPYVIDTSLIYNLRGQREIRPGLKVLSKLFLDKVIQSAGRTGHDPAEDASASMQLVLLKLKKSSTFGDAVKAGLMPFGFQEQIQIELEVRRERMKKHVINPPVSKKNLSPSNKKTISPSHKKRKDRKIETEVNLIDPVIVTTEANASLFTQFPLGNHCKRTCYTEENFQSVLRGVKEKFSEKELVFCHCKLTDCYLEPCKQSIFSEISVLDRELTALHDSLSENSLVMTLFTGSPSSVPLNNRSSAVVMLNLKGQIKENFFRRLFLDNKCR